MADAGDYDGRRVFVTGATGFIGSHLCRALLARGAVVHAIRRRPSDSTRLPANGILWHEADLLDPPALNAAVADAQPKIVFHLAAYGATPSQRDRARTIAVNIEGTWNLWRALNEISCRLVNAGSCGEYGQKKGQVDESTLCEPTWLYPATKNASVVMLSTLGRETGREVVSLRPFGPYGPGDSSDRIIPHTIIGLLRGETVSVTTGDQLRDYAYIDDQVTAFLAAGIAPLAATGAIYNVGSGEVVKLRQVLETIGRVVGGGAEERIAFGTVPYRDTEIWEMCCDISAARRDLDYAPVIPLAEGLARTIDWYRQNLPAMT